LLAIAKNPYDHYTKLYNISDGNTTKAQYIVFPNGCLKGVFSMSVQIKEPELDIEKLNQDIEQFPQVYPITDDMHTKREGVSRLVMLDRYAYKDVEQRTLAVGDLVVLTVKSDPNYPARGVGIVQKIDDQQQEADILVEEAYRFSIEDPDEQVSGIVTRNLNEIDKPLEVFYEQITKRVAHALASVDQTIGSKTMIEEGFYQQLKEMNFVPAGRVLYGAGSGANVTYFNCYVMPFVPDSRSGIAEHRKKVMEIMSRGGGVGSNGSALRPRNAIVRGVNGKSSGTVSWLDDIAKLTHLVEQGGSRRGAQMIMLADWHPDIIEFIVSKMQNARILRYLLENTNDSQIKQAVHEKLNFTPLSQSEREMYQLIVNQENKTETVSSATVKEAQIKLNDGGTYSVNNPEFLSGANISLTLTDDFMQAVKNNEEWPLRFPDLFNYSQEEMDDYDNKWPEIGDVRQWEDLGYQVATYRTIKARELWKLINICATYSAEPGIFFIDNANNKTNAVAYGQKVVATNPCGEQPLAPNSVCNLGAINLANMANKDTAEVDYDKLMETVKIAVQMQDDVIDSTPYFLEENKKQALGERRVGLGVMGLADLLIYTHHRYGSQEGNQVVDKIFETIATTAYRESIRLAKLKGSFPFLIGETEEETQELRQRFIQTGYMKDMPQDIRENILAHGIRNSHLLTVAPTGSTGTMVGVATGLEPYFAFKYYRSGRLGKFIEVNAEIVQEYLDEHPEVDAGHLPEFFVSSMELAPEEHVDVQTTIQRWVDSSISKTVNAPKGYTVEQVATIYERLYDGNAKGGTVYVDGSRDSQVLTLQSEEETEKQTSLFETEDIRIVDDSDELEQLVEQAENDHIQQEGHTDNVIYGSDVGNTCPICRQGIVKDIGGCNTCTNCQAQLRCGL